MNFSRFASALARLPILFIAVLCPYVAGADESLQSYDIEAQPMDRALKAFAAQTEIQVAFAPETVEGLVAQAVEGDFVPESALQALIDESGLDYEFASERLVVVHAPQSNDQGGASDSGNAYPTPVLMAQNQTSAPQSQTSQQSRANGNDDAPFQIEEIIVTGTSIRGVTPESSPLAVFTAQDIAVTGAVTIEQFLSKLPQNNNTLSELGVASGGREFNAESANSVDLRGLGVGTTLVLLNGRRVAPSSAGRAPDVSFIPLALVDRIEVLTDGASAIYGADAVGGVVNIILKKGQEGAETSVSYAAADGLDQVRIDQSLAFNWDSGNALLAGSYFDRTDLDASDRAYATITGPYTLIPEDERLSIMGTLTQTIPGDVLLNADLLYSTREGSTAITRVDAPGSPLQERDNDQEQLFANFGLLGDLTDDVSGEFLVSYSQTQVDEQLVVSNAGSQSFFGTEFDTTSLDLTAKLDGDLFTLSGRTVKFSVGAGYSEDDYERLETDTGDRIVRNRDTTYAFGELFVPIVSTEQAIPGINRLELTLAARYTDVSDFGDDTSPKVGLLWSPTSALKIRGTYSESFRAPFLSQFDPAAATAFIFSPAAFGFPDIWSSDGSTIAILAVGPGNPNLLPEEAESITIGFDYEPANVEGLRFSATYFDIDYEDRINPNGPDGTNGQLILVNPEDFPEQIAVNPTSGLITELVENLDVLDFAGLGIDTSDPTAVGAVVSVVLDNRLTNAAISKLDGIDITVDYTTDTTWGTFYTGLNATRIFDFTDQNVLNGPEFTRADSVLFPADLKGRAFIGLSTKSWNGSANINYVDKYDNPFTPSNPTVDDWVTLDLNFTYEFGERGSALASGWIAGLSIQNVFDEDPPFVATSGNTSDTALVAPVGFDPANANPVGRFVDLRISKRW